MHRHAFSMGSASTDPSRPADAEEFAAPHRIIQLRAARTASLPLFEGFERIELLLRERRLSVFFVQLG